MVMQVGVSGRAGGISISTCRSFLRVSPWCVLLQRLGRPALTRDNERVNSIVNRDTQLGRGPQRWTNQPDSVKSNQTKFDDDGDERHQSPNGVMVVMGCAQEEQYYTIMEPSLC